MHKKHYLAVFFLLLFCILKATHPHHPIDSLSRLLNLAEEERQRADLLNAMGKHYVRKHTDSMHYYTKQALEVSRQVNYIKGKITAYNIQAIAAFDSGDIPEGNRLIDKAKKLLDTVDFPKGLGDNLYAHSFAYYGTGEYEKCLEKLSNALPFYQETKDLEGQCLIYNGIGRIYADIRQYERALDAYEEFLAKSKILNNAHYISNAYNNIAIIHDNEQRYVKALAYFQSSLDIANQLNDRSAAAVRYNNMGVVYEKLGDYERAKKNYNILLKIGEESKNNRYLLACYDNFGNVALKEKKYQTAEKYYNQALDMAERINDTPLKGLCYSNIGKVKRFLKDYDTSIRFLQKGITIHEEAGQIKELAYAKVALAESYKAIGEDAKAMAFAKEAYDWANAQDDTERIVIREAAEVLSKLYERANNYQKAYAYHQQYKIASDKLQDRAIIQAMAVQQLQQDYEEEEQAKRKEEAEQKRAAAIERRNQRIGAFVLLAILLTIIGMVSNRYLILRKKNKLIEQQKEEISEQHAALEAQTEKLTRLNATKDKLFAIISHDLRGPIGSLESVLAMLLSKELSKTEFLDMASDLKQNTANIHQMLDNLLQWSYRQMNGSISTITTTVNAYKQAENVVGFLDELAKEKSLVVVNKVDKDLLVKADYDHFNLILRNLLSNAIKFTDYDGKIIISSKQTADVATICVSDTGVGMTEMQILQLFQESSTTPRWGTAGEKGVGLGLTLCKEMVTKNGGKIWVESTPDEGSSFFFTLPMVEAPVRGIKSVHSSSV